jgi:hypothetical protein
MMNRRELMRLMPRNGNDVDGAEHILALGYPAIAPVLPDIVRWLRVAESPVADAFADLLADLGDPAIEAVAWHGLRPDNCWARHRILCRVLPRWSDSALQRITFMLSTTATQPDAYDNDLRAIEILADRGLADPKWLAGWLEFKQGRLDARVALLARAKHAVDRANSRGS